MKFTTLALLVTVPILFYTNTFSASTSFGYFSSHLSGDSFAGLGLFAAKQQQLGPSSDGFDGSMTAFNNWVDPLSMLVILDEINWC